MNTTTGVWLRVIVFQLVAFPLVLVAYRGIPIPLPGRPFTGWALGVLCAAVLITMHRVFARKDGTSISDVGFPGSRITARHLTGGFLAGASLVAVAAFIFGVLLPVEWQLNRNIAVSTVMIAAVHHAITNTCEEFAWRGYVLFSLNRRAGIWPALFIVALVSATFHVVCGWTWRVALTHTAAGSLLFSLVVLRWNSIPAAIGLHVGWNLTRDAALSFPTVGPTVLIPTPTRVWTPTEWTIGEAILIGLTLVSCAWLWSRTPNWERGRLKSAENR